MLLDPTNIDRPIQATAFARAVADLAEAHPEAVDNKLVLDAVLKAVIDLAAAGQTDVEQLARYAASRGAAVYSVMDRR